MKKFEYVETTIVQRGCAEKSDQKQIRRKYWGKLFLKKVKILFSDADYNLAQTGDYLVHLLSFSNEIYSLPFDGQIFM